MSDIQYIDDDFMADIKEDVFEKYIPEGVENATIIEISKIGYNKNDSQGETRVSKEEEDVGKKPRIFKKMFFRITYGLDDKLDNEGHPKLISESYGFRVYEDTKTLWWGTEKSACGSLIAKIKKYHPELGKNPTFLKIKELIIGKSVKICSAEFGPSKTQKIVIDSFK
jgi:hypothetical protein